EAIACRRRLGFSIDCQEHIPAVEMDPALSARLAMAIGECGVRTFSLSSGAGHDAAIMAAVFPTSMLFLRCLEGVSHHPEESVRSEDVAIALEVLVRMVHNLAVEHDQK